MAEKYQSNARKSSKKFEMLGRKELAVSLPLRLVEVSEELQPEVEHFDRCGRTKNHPCGDRGRSEAACGATASS